MDVEQLLQAGLYRGIKSEIVVLDLKNRQFNPFHVER